MAINYKLEWIEIIKKLIFIFFVKSTFIIEQTKYICIPLICKFDATYISQIYKIAGFQKQTFCATKRMSKRTPKLVFRNTKIIRERGTDASVLVFGANREKFTPLFISILDSVFTGGKVFVQQILGMFQHRFWSKITLQFYNTKYANIIT